MKYNYKQKDQLDRFYTKDAIAKKCVGYLKLDQYSQIIEPSAGGGAFVRALNNQCDAYDIDPLTPWIIQDFLVSSFTNKKILVIGNPPFGKNGSLAIKFINHASKFSNTIAFILSNAFRKENMMNKIDKTLILKKVYNLPLNSFILNGEDYSIPCSFFIYEKLSSGVRPTIKKESCNFIEFTSKENATFSVRRVGINAGKASWNLEVSPSSNYFIKADKKIFDLFNESFECVKWCSGPPSLSKNELLRELNKRISE
jgi:hypothetical protein